MHYQFLQNRQAGEWIRHHLYGVRRRHACDSQGYDTDGGLGELS